MNSYMPATSSENVSEGGSDEDSSNSSFKYKSEDLLETAKAMQEVSASTSQQLIWIASISLLVGGIGVMNIMLVSVTERTSEIGLKKGKFQRSRSTWSLWNHSAPESLSPALINPLPYISSYHRTQVISKVSDMPVAISIPAAVGAVVFSMLIGIIFGMLPSYKAANLNPIDALRHE